MRLGWRGTALLDGANVIMGIKKQFVKLQHALQKKNYCCIIQLYGFEGHWMIYKIQQGSLHSPIERENYGIWDTDLSIHKLQASQQFLH